MPANMSARQDLVEARPSLVDPSGRASGASQPFAQ